MSVTCPGSASSSEQTPSPGHVFFRWLRRGVCALVPTRLKLLPLDPHAKAEAEDNGHTALEGKYTGLVRKCHLFILLLGV